MFGGGAIGGHLCGWLTEAGVDVSMLARGESLKAIRDRGLRIIKPDGEFHSRPTVTDDPAALGPQDIVLVAVKGPAVPSVAGTIGPLLGPQTAVVFVLNGIPWWYNHSRGGPEDGAAIPLLDPDGGIAAAVSAKRVIGGVIYSLCTVREPGVIFVENAQTRMILGEPNGAMSARIEAIAAPLRQAGMRIEVTSRIRDAIWAKLLVNLGSGLSGVLTASASRDFLKDPAIQGATRAILEEAHAVATAVGCTVHLDVDEAISSYSKIGHKQSILQDLEARRPMEIDGLYSVPLAMARNAGVATPTLDLMIALVKARARAAGLYPG